MPTCSEGYRSREVDEIMGNRSVVQVAQELVECVSGVCDGQPPGFKEDCLKVLQFYVSHWTPSQRTYDDAVLALIKEAMVFAEEREKP